MKLATKLTSGFGSVLVLMLILAGISYWTISDSSSSFTLYRGMARETNLSGRLQANMLMLRMNMKDFIITGSDKDLNEFEDYYQKVNGFLETAKDEIHDPERARLVARADELVKEYGAYFKKVQEYRRQRDSILKDTIFSVGTTMEENLTKILSAAEERNESEVAFHCGLAIRFLLQARLNATQFLIDNSKKSVERVHKSLEAMERELAALRQNLDSMEDTQLVDETEIFRQGFDTAFIGMSDTVFALNALVSQHLNVIGPEVAKAMEDVKLSIMSEQAVLGPKVQSENDLAIESLVILGIIALAIGIGMAVLIIRSTLRQLGKDPAEIAAIADSIAGGNLDIAFDDKAVGVYLDMKIMAARVAEVIGDVREGAANVSTGSSELSASAQTLSQGATEQASSIEEISASMEEMASNIQQNTENSTATQSIAEQAAREAEASGIAVDQTVEAMKHIAEKISIIEEIARQTNLLALNAAIEAARAGDHGKGFAVVAAEVRKLAERSGTAAREISELSTTTVGDAEKAGEMLAELVPNIRRTADLVQEISAASLEQNAGAEQVNQAISQLDTVIQQNAAAAEETASTSEELAGQATQLEQAIAFFKVGGPGRGRTAASVAKAYSKSLPTSNPQASGPSAGGASVAPAGIDMRLEDNDGEFERF
ncbi:HAMP domain-containing methyl-accepting chemotaxis protein [Pseudodesulfovibrio sp.]|uniref:HAMP domain-containing methyl-accepting chemotaxis protein n=1 Tax=unclassified Pseudodesulfovibrio TaxID=2661612 RepID=UPI003AFFE70B